MFPTLLTGSQKAPPVFIQKSAYIMRSTGDDDSDKSGYIGTYESMCCVQWRLDFPTYIPQLWRVFIIIVIITIHSFHTTCVVEREKEYTLNGSLQARCCW